MLRKYISTSIFHTKIIPFGVDSPTIHWVTQWGIPVYLWYLPNGPPSFPEDCQSRPLDAGQKLVRQEGPEYTAADVQRDHSGVVRSSHLSVAGGWRWGQGSSSMAEKSSNWTELFIAGKSIGKSSEKENIGKSTIDGGLNGKIVELLLWDFPASHVWLPEGMLMGQKVIKPCIALLTSKAGKSGYLSFTSDRRSFITWVLTHPQKRKYRMWARGDFHFTMIQKTGRELGPAGEKPEVFSFPPDSHRRWCWFSIGPPRGPTRKRGWTSMSPPWHHPPVPRNCQRSKV